MHSVSYARTRDITAFLLALAMIFGATFFAPATHHRADATLERAD